MLLRSLMIGPCRRRQPSLQRACVDGTNSRIPSLGADPEVFLLIRATLDRLNLRVKPADAVLEGGVLAARDRLVMEGVSRRVNVTREPDLPCSPVEAVVESDL
jgi:hypothetical protein